MQARTFNQGRLVAAGLAFAAAVVAVLVISALSDSGASVEAPSVTPAASPVAPPPTQKQHPLAPAQAAPLPLTRTSSKRSVIVQSGRSVKGRSVTVQGAPGEAVTATATGRPGSAATGSAKGGAGGSASGKGGSATSGSVEIQTVGP